MSKDFIYISASGFETEATAFESADFVSTSAGAGDSGKPILLDAGGHVDASMINDADIDHGGIGGLGDDDHTIYSLADGTRNYSAKVSYSSHPSFSADTEIVDKKYVDDLVSGQEWKDSALDYVTDNTLVPATEVSGDRYVLSDDGGAPHANWDGASAGDIVEFNGTSWISDTPTTGTYISVDDENDGVYLFSGSVWTKKIFEATTASLGCQKVGLDIRAAYSTGLTLSGNDLILDFSTAFNDAKAIQASDLSSTANALGASIIGSEDAGAYFAGADVEAILQEIGGQLIERGVDYTAGTGGVTKGDAVYVSANNEVLPLGTITNEERVIGLCASTEIATATVKVLANDTVLAGVLTTATAGDDYFWDGSNITSTIPSGTGAYVWKVGTAKNADDLHVEVEFLKKNK